MTFYLDKTTKKKIIVLSLPTEKQIVKSIRDTSKFLKKKKCRVIDEILKLIYERYSYINYISYLSITNIQRRDSSR